MVLPGSRYVVVFCVTQSRSEKVVPLSDAALPVPVVTLPVLTMSVSWVFLPLTVSNLHLLGFVTFFWVTLNGPFFPPPLFHVTVVWMFVSFLKVAVIVSAVAG